jgi:hypothetical protein
MSELDDLLSAASSSRQRAIDLNLGGQAELSAFYVQCAMLDATLALVVLKRDRGEASDRRQSVYAAALENLMSRLPVPGEDAAGVLESEEFTTLGPEPVPGPARLRWLADRLLDSAWNPMVREESAVALLELANRLVADLHDAPKIAPQGAARSVEVVRQELEQLGVPPSAPLGTVSGCGPDHASSGGEAVTRSPDYIAPHVFNSKFPHSSCQTCGRDFEDRCHVQ